MRLPGHMAAAALAAWERDDDQLPLLEPETVEQRVVRFSAATLELIGLAVKTGGRWEAYECVVFLSAQFVGDALFAAEPF